MSALLPHRHPYEHLPSTDVRTQHNHGYIFRKMLAEEMEEFRSRYRKYEELKIFRTRSPEEIDELAANNWFLTTSDGRIVASAAMIHEDNDWTEIAAVSVDEPGNGIGRVMLDNILAITRGKFVYSLTADPAIRLFENGRFGHWEKVSCVQQSTVKEYAPKHVRGYDITDRDPQMLVLWNLDD